ncbi:uncharacterized protein LOC124200510 [Daphnia pulex]|uniref:uncharacterized protein LOC124200510 n=1 Tax=Daphnia pulex TaxID=6669 RepID=UPI001EDE7294|nr:uncharacterized protein LOC124200510 [Daphnia pulex]
MDVICEFCGAIHFKGELGSGKKFNLCCSKGKVILPPPQECPELLQLLFTHCHPQSANFIKDARQNNNALAFASLGASIDVLRGRRPYCFKIHGQLYHNTTAVQYYDEEISVPPALKYAQLYFLDSNQANKQRLNNPANRSCDSALMEQLDALIRRVNPYAVMYKNMRQVAMEEDRQAAVEGRAPLVVSMVIHNDRRTQDERRYNSPAGEEIAVMLKSIGGAPPENRDIRGHLLIPRRGKVFIRIDTQKPMCDPMTYPLLFPNGDSGWDQNLKRRYLNEDQDNVSHDHNEEQELLDGESRIADLNDEEVQIRSEIVPEPDFETEVDFDPDVPVPIYDVNRRGPRSRITQCEFYSSQLSIRSPRAMKQGYQDAMAICSRFGKPTYFLTFTCNPKWQEITERIESYQVVANRPDVVARVYQLKLKELIKDIQEKQILGVVVARIHVIEFQKRGLPHCHMLIWIDQHDVPTTEFEIDKTISAEIPDPETHPELHKIIMSNMIHGPCGTINPNSPCMDGSKCTKSFPKSFSPSTVINSNGYPTYRRRDTGISYPLNDKPNFRRVDNSWVVPFNAYLSLKYNSHINLEFCASVTSVKYIFKYIYKGHDCANVQISRAENQQGQQEIVWDETKQFLEARYVSAPEACWRILKYPLCFRSHAVSRLAVHLPQEQPVYFQPGFEDRSMLNAATKITTLTAWFKLNQDHESARQYYYREIPNHFCFDKNQRRWKPRKKRINVIGRIFSVGVKQVERHSLRLLLLEVKGVTSFEYLRTVDNILYPTFKEAAIARNLLADDSAWEKVMEEAAAFEMPIQLRQLFVDICCHCRPTNAQLLFKNNLQHLTVNYTRNGHGEEVAKNLALKWIQDKKGEGKKVIAVAPTGIASTLLIDGATYHSQFKIYPPITETTRSKIEEHHFLAKLIRDAALIIEDEATVMTNHALNAIKHVTEKMTKNNKPFGNKVLLLGEDFRQCLPVVKHGNRVKVVEATIKNCESWSTFRHIRLTENMRTTAGSQEYANWLIELGNGTLPTTGNLSSNVVEIPPYFLITEENAESFTGDDQDPRISALIHHVFGDPKHLLDQDFSEEVNSRAILCPKNDECLKINNAIIKNMPGEEFVYKSIDTITGDEEEVANFPTEFLNTLKISGIPPHTFRSAVHPKQTLSGGGVDMVNQLRSYYERDGKAKKLWHRLLYSLGDLSGPLDILQRYGRG